MTATAFIDGIKKMPSLLPLQAEQLISLAPRMSEKQLADTFAKIKKEHGVVEENLNEMDDIQDAVEKETKKIYKKEWPKIQKAVEKEESTSATAKLDEQIGNA